MSDDAKLVFGALGGAGEIGMNLYLYGVGPANDRRWLIVDLGVTFADAGQPGIDLIYPDISFLEKNRKRIDGLVLTHAHEDHFGAVLDLLPRLGVPVHATPFSAGLLEAKQAENGYKPGAIDIQPIALGGRRTIGAFDVEFITVAHSIAEPNALAIRTPEGLLLHSGDWKLDPEPVIGTPTDMDRMEEIGREGVRALICDSTNAMRDGDSPSEGDVGREIASIIRAAERRVAVTIFASNLARLKSVYLAARAADREVVAVGRAMHRIIGVARETGYLDKTHVFRTEDDYGYLPSDKVVLLCTGSQGEPRAALSRIARDDHPRITLSKGDLVIFSSRTIPGNERVVGAVQNALIRQGIEIITDADRPVHVSGHPRRGELLRLYEALKPEIIVPVHGEARHMTAQAKLARDAGIPHGIVIYNGDLVALDRTPVDVVDQLAAGRLHQDGDLIVGEDDPGLRERRKLGFAGAAFVSLTMDDRGNLLDGPEISLVGLPGTNAKDDRMLDAALDGAEGVLQGLPRGRRRDPDAVAESVRRGVIGAIRSLWGKKPVCEVHVSVVEWETR